MDILAKVFSVVLFKLYSLLKKKQKLTLKTLILYFKDKLMNPIKKQANKFVSKLYFLLLLGHRFGLVNLFKCWDAGEDGENWRGGVIMHKGHIEFCLSYAFKHDYKNLGFELNMC